MDRLAFALACGLVGLSSAAALVAQTLGPATPASAEQVDTIVDAPDEVDAFVERFLGGRPNRCESARLDLDTKAATTLDYAERCRALRAGPAWQAWPNSSGIAGLLVDSQARVFRFSYWVTTCGGANCSTYFTLWRIVPPAELPDQPSPFASGTPPELAEFIERFVGRVPTSCGIRTRDEESGVNFTALQRAHIEEAIACGLEKTRGRNQFWALRQEQEATASYEGLLGDDLGVVHRIRYWKDCGSRRCAGVLTIQRCPRPGVIGGRGNRSRLRLRRLTRRPSAPASGPARDQPRAEPVASRVSGGPVATIVGPLGALGREFER